MKFREYTLESGKQIFLGKDASNNDKLVRAAKRKDVLLHTAAPGSPFCNVGEAPTSAEIKQAAIVCARYSQDWRNNKKDVMVHEFLRSDTSKRKSMKMGCWGVKKQKDMKVKKIDIEKFEKETKKLNP